MHRNVHGWQLMAGYKTEQMMTAEGVVILLVGYYMPMGLNQFVLSTV